MCLNSKHHFYSVSSQLVNVQRICFVVQKISKNIHHPFKALHNIGKTEKLNCSQIYA